MSNRLIQALIAYAVLVIAACFLLSGTVLLAILVVLAAFLAKTLLWHYKPEDTLSDVNQEAGAGENEKES